MSYKLLKKIVQFNKLVIHVIGLIKKLLLMNKQTIYQIKINKMNILTIMIQINITLNF